MSEWVILSRKRRKKKRPVRPRAPELTEKQILAWADAYHERTGKWPKPGTVPKLIPNSLGETWRKVDNALRWGLRGLPGGSSLPRLLAERRNVRNTRNLPPLSVMRILGWADDYYWRTGDWPSSSSGRIKDSQGETWGTVSTALMYGLRGLKGRSSLPQLLAEHRGVRNVQNLPPLTKTQILCWADAFYQRTGRWPMKFDGPIAEAPGETWMAIYKALYQGGRGLPGGSTLSRLLAEHRGVRKIGGPPLLTQEQVLAWADAHHKRTGEWPRRGSGQITESPQETWQRIDDALLGGHRGLRGGSSLARLLAEKRGIRNSKGLPPLSMEVILSWADTYHAATGIWPMSHSGPIPQALAPGETWATVDKALRRGTRQLSGCSSLAQLLAASRGIRNRKQLPALTPQWIIRHAKAHRQRTGQWPNCHAGPIADAPGETWLAVDSALREGGRGLPGGTSLYRLLQGQRVR